MVKKLFAVSILALTLSAPAIAFDDNGLPTKTEEIGPFCFAIGQLAYFLNQSVIENGQVKDVTKEQLSALHQEAHRRFPQLSDYALAMTLKAVVTEPISKLEDEQKIETEGCNKVFGQRVGIEL